MMSSRVVSTNKESFLSTNKESFLYDMVSASFFSFKTGLRDVQALSLAQRIEEETKREEASIMLNYSNRVEYCLDMEFNWHEDTPPELKALEDWWVMIEKGVDPGEAYMFFMANIPNYVTNGFQSAYVRSHTMWKPPGERFLIL